MVLFRSYTGAQIRYYIDRATGETYVTEFVPGITAQEQQTEERLNVRDYLLSVPGTWQTASVEYEADGTMQPEYYVRFSDTEIIYGHMKDGEFVPDHADKIICIADRAAGGYRIWAEAAAGARYTYQTAEGDNTLECYETWDEDDFPGMYRGGASLSRVG